MNNERLRQLLVSKNEIKPDPELEWRISEMVEMALKCNPANKIILDLIAHPEEYNQTYANYNR